MRRISVLFFVLLLPPRGVTSEEAARIVTLSQSINEALANGDEYKILQGNLEAGRAQHALNVSKDSFSLAGSLGYVKSDTFGNTAAFAGQSIPSSGVTFPAGPQAGLVLSGPLTSAALNAYPVMPLTGTGAGSDSSAFTLALNQTLWSGYPGGSARATVDKSLLALQGKELAAESGRLSLIYNVKLAYYATLSAQQGLASKNETLLKQKAILTQIQATYDLKLTSLVDLKTAQLNADGARVDLDSAERDLRAARSSLAALMGRPVTDEFQVDEEQDPGIPVDSLEKAISEGLSRRTDVKQMELNVKSGNIELAVAKGQATPTVNVNGGVSVLYNWNGKDVGEVTAGVKVSMPVLDAGAVKNQVDAIQRQNDVYAAQEDQLVRNITTSIRNAWDGVQIAREKLEYAKLAAETTDLRLRILKVQQENGTASAQDLLTASVNAANALAALQAAKNASQLAVLMLENVMGY